MTQALHLETFHSEVARGPVLFWRFQDEFGVWRAGLASNDQDAVAQAIGRGLKGDNVTEKQTAVRILREEVNVAGDVSIRTYHLRIPLRGPIFMACQVPLTEGPKPRRCLKPTWSSRSRYCVEHRPS